MRVSAQDEALTELEEAQQAVEAAKNAVAAAAAAAESSAEPSEAGPADGKVTLKGRSRLCKRSSSKDDDLEGACTDHLAVYDGVAEMHAQHPSFKIAG